MDTIERMMLDVLDAPNSLRVIIDTKLPTIDSTPEAIESLSYGEEFPDTLYYMIDRSPDQGETASEMWKVSASSGGWFEIPAHALLLKFVKRITNECPNAKIWVESY